jgi:hypothetical protein
MNAYLNFSPLPDGLSFLLLGVGSILAALFMRRRIARVREGKDAKGMSAVQHGNANPMGQRPGSKQPSSAAPFKVEEHSLIYHSSSNGH